MNEYNRRLQSTFLFDNADLRTNRSGQLSARQLARLRATSGSQRLVLVIFGVVILVSLGFVFILGLRPAAIDRSLLISTLIGAGIVLAIIGIAILASWPYMTRANPRRAVIAKGKATAGRVQPGSARYEIMIGASRLRFSTEEHFTAFQPGVEYRLFYLPGPVVVVLSGEVVGTEAEADPIPGEVEEPLTGDAVVELNRRGRWIAVGIGVLAIAIPAVGFVVTSLPPGLRWIAYGGMLVVAIGFVYWALKRLNG